MKLSQPEIKLLSFLQAYPDQWHGFNTDRETVNAVIALSQRPRIGEYLEIDDDTQQMFWHRDELQRQFPGAARIDVKPTGDIYLFYFGGLREIVLYEE